MIYTGKFKDLLDAEYTVSISNTATTGSTDILLSDTPFTTTIEGEDTLYKPLKLSSATINVVSNNYLFDIYSPTAQGTSVKLFDKNNTIIWIGYLTPCLYTQSYENEFETFELEAIDALSTLDYYKYVPIDGSYKAGIHTLEEIMIHCIEKCNAYSSIYLSANSKISKDYADTNIFDDLIISEWDFMAEDSDDNLTYKEVLTEICKFLGLTATADGDKIFLLDYDAIKNNVNNYWLYTGSTFSGKTLVTLSDQKAITKDEYMDTDGKLSLMDVYNKINVTNNKSIIDDIIPAFFQEKYLTNTQSNILPFFTQTKAIDKKTYCYRTYWDSNWKNYYYTDDTSWAITNPSAVDIDTFLNTIGASFVQVADYDTNTNDEVQGSLSYSNYLFLHRHQDGDNNNVAMPVLELVSTTASTRPYILGGCEIVIKGSAMWVDRPGYESMMPIEFTRKNDNYNKNNLYLTAKLQIGNQFWNGTYWNQQESTFKILFDNVDTSHFIGKWKDVKNTIAWTDGIDATGYGIQINPNMDLHGITKFTLYCPACVDSSYSITGVWLKDFTVSIENEKIWNETDTLYTNIIDENYASELSDIECKITSYDNKNLGYNTVGKTTGSYVTFFNSIYNIALNQTLRPEYMICYRYVNQYHTPSKILELTLKNDAKPYSLITENNLQTQFIVDTQQIDYANNSNKIKLVEKK